MDIKAVLLHVISLIGKFNKRQRVVIAVSVILLVGFFVFLLVFSVSDKSKTGGYAVLFEGMNSSDNALVLQYLQQNRVPYQVVSEDTILIPKDQVYEQRIALASKGIPKTSKVGFEIFDKKDFGMTDEEHKVKLLRAIEGELSRTIEFLSPISKAHVFIAIPRESVFVSQKTPPTASVTLGLKPGAQITNSQIFGIKNLVAAAVPNLSVENVKIVSQNGEPLGEENEASYSNDVAAMQLKYKRNIESLLESKIVSIISPIVGGEDKVVANVTADFDFSQRKSLQEIYDPNNVIRSEQNVEEKKEGAQRDPVGGVPGAVSNIGPVQGLEDGNLKEKYERNQNVTNYEVGKTVNEIRGEFGVLTRLSASVVIDGRYKKVVKDGVDRIEYIPFSQDELARIASLVQQAIGYNSDRGDSVQVDNFEFNAYSENSIPQNPLHQYLLDIRGYIDPIIPLLKYLLVALIIFIFYRKVVVPFTQRMLEVHKVEEEKNEPLFEVNQEEEFSRFGEMRKRVEEKLGITNQVNEEEVKYDVLLERIKATIEDKPEEFATLLKVLVKDDANANLKQS